jgi:hypothetical protein
VELLSLVIGIGSSVKSVNNNVGNLHKFCLVLENIL